jgi:hypothetical protein
MTTTYDGTYSVFAAGTAGTSIGVIHVSQGKVIGNDMSGARYAGRLNPLPNSKVEVDLEMTLPPNTFGIWGTSAAETFEIRAIKFAVDEKAFREGNLQHIGSYGLNVVFTLVPDDQAHLAGPDGLREWAEALQRAQAAWDGYDKDS